MLLRLLSLSAALFAASAHAEPATQTLRPNNVLERRLQAVQAGDKPLEDFIHVLIDSQVTLLSKREVMTMDDPTDLPALVLPAGAEGGEMLAVFTSPEFAHRVAESYPAYRYGVETDFLWVLAHAAPGIGVAINPGWTLGLRIPSYGILRLRERYTDRIEARSQ